MAAADLGLTDSGRQGQHPGLDTQDPSRLTHMWPVHIRTFTPSLEASTEAFLGIQIPASGGALQASRAILGHTAPDL